MEGGATRRGRERPDVRREGDGGGRLGSWRGATARDRRIAVAGLLWTVCLAAAYAEVTQAGERCRPPETLYCVAAGHSRLHIGLVLAVLGFAAATAWLAGEARTDALRRRRGGRDEVGDG